MKTTSPTPSQLERCEANSARALVSRFEGADGPTLASAEEAETGKPVAMPMWSRVWNPDGRRLTEFLRPLGPPERPEDADEHDATTRAAYAQALADWAEANGLEVPDALGRSVFAASAWAEDLDGLDGIRKALAEAWRESGDDLAELDASGWQAVGDTGILAREFAPSGDLYLGINGCGYDFYSAHWLPLYRALDLDWHVSDYRRERADRAAAEVCAEWKRMLAPGEPLHVAFRAAVEALDRTRTALGNGGPLEPWELDEARP